MLMQFVRKAYERLPALIENNQSIQQIWVSPINYVESNNFLNEMLERGRFASSHIRPAHETLL